MIASYGGGHWKDVFNRQRRDELLAIAGIGVVAFLASQGTPEGPSGLAVLTLGLFEVGTPAAVMSDAHVEPPDVAIRSLSAEQKALVGTVMEAWVSAPPIRETPPGL